MAKAILGNGTTAGVAQPLVRHYLGIDCVADYREMARWQINNGKPLFA